VMAAFGLKPRSKAQMAAKLTALWCGMAKQKGVQLDDKGQVVAGAALPAPPAPLAAAVAVAAPKPSKRKAAAGGAASAAAPSVPASAASQPLLDITLASSNGSNIGHSAVPAVVLGNASASASAVLGPASASKVSDDALSRFPFPPSALVPPSLASDLRAWLRSQADLHVRILLFQPLEVSDVWLCAKSAGLQCDVLQLRSFLDAEGISNTLKDPNTPAAGEGAGGEGAEQPPRPKKAGAAHVPKGRFRRR